MEKVEHSKLGRWRQQLLYDAERVMETAYNPYSGFYVGAALLGTNGETYTGSNVENAAYGSTICAERAALMNANAHDVRIFKALAIIARGADFDTQEVSASCGSCRQMLYEAAQLGEGDLEIILSTTKKDKIVITSIRELLPIAFGPLDLGVDVSRFQTKKAE